MCRAVPRDALTNVIVIGVLLGLAGCGVDHAATNAAPPTPTTTLTVTPTVTPNECLQAGEHCTFAGAPCCAGLGCCSGVPVPPGEEFCGDVCPVSDRRAKTNIEPVNPSEILARVASLPISTWSYVKDANRAKHMGPMAQDFWASFGLGASDLCIPTVDASGVALASIQALNERVEALRQENEELKADSARLRARLDRLEQQLRGGRRKTKPQHSERRQ